MHSTKPAVFVAMALTLVAGVFTGLKFSEEAQAKAAVASLGARELEAAAQVAALETRLQAETKHAEEVEADNALLAGALKQATLAQAQRAAKAAEPVTRDEVEARFKRAQTLTKSGDPAEALRELLWCQEAYLQLGGSMRGRASSVVTAIGQLGERYPAALEALRGQLEALRKKVLAGPGGADAVSEFSAVARALKDDQAMLDLYDEVPAGDRRRTSLGIYAFDQLLTAKRYGDAAAGRPFATMSSSFEMITAERALPPSITNVAQARSASRNFAIATTGKNIEVLAGSGDLAHARALIDRLLAYDNTDGTKAIVQQRLVRAGHPELLSSPTP